MDAASRHTRLQQGLALITVVLGSVAILSPVQGTDGVSTGVFTNVSVDQPSKSNPTPDECGGFAAGTTLSQCGMEIPALTASSFSYGTTGSAWTFEGPSGVSSDRSGFTGPQSAPEGAQVAFIQHTGSFSQSIDGFVAGSYTLTFNAAQRYNFGGRQDFAVRLDEVVLGVFEPADYRYRELRTSFVASSGAHTIEFIGLNTAGGDNTAFIDKIRLVRDGPPGCVCPTRALKRA